MRLENRLILAVGIVVLDVVILFIPVTALFLGYILLSRPSWFKEWIQKVYQTD